MKKIIIVLIILLTRTAGFSQVGKDSSRSNRNRSPGTTGINRKHNQTDSIHGNDNMRRNNRNNNKPRNNSSSNGSNNNQSNSQTTTDSTVIQPQ